MSNALEKELQRVKQLLQSGQIDQARNACQKAVKRFSKKVEPCVLLAHIEQSQGRSEALLYALSKACQRAPQDLQLKVNYGDAAMSVNHYSVAAKVYREGMKLQPQQEVWKARLAAALQQLPSSLNEAIALYRELIIKAPNEAMLHYNLGTALKRQHDFDATLEAYRQALRLAPNDVDIHFSLCNLLAELERFEELIDATPALLALKPDASKVYEWLYYANKKLLRTQASLSAVERLIELEGQTATNLGFLASAHIANKAYAIAVKQCDLALKKTPTDRRILADKTIALSAQSVQLGTNNPQDLFQLDNFLFTQQIDVPTHYNNIQMFNNAIIEHVSDHPHVHFSGVSHSCHRGATSNELFVEPLGPVEQLIQAIENSIEEYRQQLSRLLGADSGALKSHPWLSHLPEQERLDLSGWMTRLRSQGFQQGHMHPTGWISGVYYLSLPPEVGGDDNAGYIEFGRAPEYYPNADQGKVSIVKPLAGTLVLFPSYFYHRTIPFASDHERFTIAFDYRKKDLS